MTPSPPSGRRCSARAFARCSATRTALLRNPYSKASAAVGPYENDRRAMVAPGMLVEYAVLHGLMVIVVVDVLDEYLTTYLIDEADEAPGS